MFFICSCSQRVSSKHRESFAVFWSGSVTPWIRAEHMRSTSSPHWHRGIRIQYGGKCISTHPSTARHTQSRNKSFLQSRNQVPMNTNTIKTITSSISYQQTASKEINLISRLHQPSSHILGLTSLFTEQQVEGSRLI